MRIGHGFDVHAFGGEGPIIIGGVRIPYEKGLLAHSDGDVALHALTDALLGAAALGDIGKLFPDTDPAFKGADSRELLREAWASYSGQKAIRSATSTSPLSPRRRNAAAYSADARLYR
ncbi:2-C-methyl-D-erythritol 2,4-cyclo diphosphate synthase [Klebsiella aerogenes]|nr:2-C-methyl-D-erythritol 2,4-cyclo diphosphate synthase [Klebsiella aerogenes]